MTRPNALGNRRPTRADIHTTRCSLSYSVSNNRRRLSSLSSAPGPGEIVTKAHQRLALQCAKDHVSCHQGFDRSRRRLHRQSGQKSPKRCGMHPSAQGSAQGLCSCWRLCSLDQHHRGKQHGPEGRNTLELSGTGAAGMVGVPSGHLSYLMLMREGRGGERIDVGPKVEQTPEICLACYLPCR